jgi:Ribbon-helix-helix protein, copG family.
MTRKTLGTRADEQIHEAIEALAADRGMSKSDAVELTIANGLEHLGYDRARSSPAVRILTHAAVGMFHVGATLVLLSALTSISFAFAGVMVGMAALATVIIADYVVPRFEPGISNALPRLVRYG